MVGGKGIRRSHTAGLAQFQSRAKDCATSGAPFVLAQREQTFNTGLLGVHGVVMAWLPWDPQVGRVQAQAS